MAEMDCPYDYAPDAEQSGARSARLAALAPWIHQYNHHRPHSAIGRVAPITRLDNLAGHHN